MAFPLLDIIGAARTILERVLPDPAQKAAALQHLAELEQSGDLQVIANQIEIAKIDAASNDSFQRRARPFVMWVCGAGFAIQFVLNPLLAWGTKLAGHPIEPPIMDTGLLTGMLTAMLGLGGYRTIEKLQGKA